MNVKNVKYIDILKGLGIMLVVIAHSKAPFTNFINLFHMPLFFFISGYLYKRSSEEKLVSFIKKKVKSLYLPFVKYSLIFLALHNILFKLNIYSENVSYGGNIVQPYSAKEFIKSFISIITFGSTEQLGGALWFFTSLFTVTIFFFILRIIFNKFSSNLNRYIFAVIIALCFIIGYYTNFPRNLSTSLVAILVYYLGYIYRGFEDIIKIHWLGAGISFIILLLASNYGSISMVKNSYTNPLFFIVCSVLGIYMMLYISKFIDRNINNNLFAYVGQNTVIIMALHFLAFKFISFLIVIIYSEPYYMIAKFPVIYPSWWIAYSIIGIVIPLLINFLINQIKIKIKNL